MTKIILSFVVLILLYFVQRTAIQNGYHQTIIMFFSRKFSTVKKFIRM